MIGRRDAYRKAVTKAPHSLLRECACMCSLSKFVTHPSHTDPFARTCDAKYSSLAVLLCNSIFALIASYHWSQQTIGIVVGFFYMLTGPSNGERAAVGGLCNTSRLNSTLAYDRDVEYGSQTSHLEELGGPSPRRTKSRPVA